MIDELTNYFYTTMSYFKRYLQEYYDILSLYRFNVVSEGDQAIGLIYISNHTEKYVISIPLKIFYSYIAIYDKKYHLLYVLCGYLTTHPLLYNRNIVHKMIDDEEFYFNFTELHIVNTTYHQDLPFLFSKYYSIENPMLDINGVNDILKSDNKDYTVRYGFQHPRLRVFVYFVEKDNSDHKLYFNENFYYKYLKPYSYILDLISIAIEYRVDNNYYENDILIKNEEILRNALQIVHNRHRIWRCRFCGNDNMGMDACKCNGGLKWFL